MTSAEIMSDFLRTFLSGPYFDSLTRREQRILTSVIQAGIQVGKNADKMLADFERKFGNAA